MYEDGSVDENGLGIGGSAVTHNGTSVDVVAQKFMIICHHTGDTVNISVVAVCFRIT